MDSKKTGLDIQLNLYKFFFDSDYMHYGYWPSGLDVKAINLRQAQENYSQFTFSHIPKEVKSIADIGCGAGKVAEELINLGYNVTCISPPSHLTDKATERLTGKAKVYASGFEDFKCNGEKFDLIFFSESYQYIDIQKGFEQCNRLLNPGGYILLSDFFHIHQSKGPLGGGHRLSVFYDELKHQPFELVEDLDITERIAPTMTLINSLTMDVIYPGVMLLGEFIQKRYPLLYKFLCWKFKKKIEKNRVKHFTGQRNPENFKKFKSYRLVILKKNETKS